MNWLRDFFTTHYNTVSAWVYLHPVRTDIIIGAVVLGSLAYLILRRASVRRRARRVRWGIRMSKSKNRETTERAIISYGICDAIEEAVYRQEMTRERANHWYHHFANNDQMVELLPVKNVKTTKRGIRYRLNTGVHRIKAVMPGYPKGFPFTWAAITGQEKAKGIDPNYKPVHTAPKLTSKRSKYATAS